MFLSSNPHKTWSSRLQVHFQSLLGNFTRESDAREPGRNIMKYLLFILALMPAIVHAGGADNLLPSTYTDPGSVEERRMLAAVQQQRLKLVERERQLDNRELELGMLEDEIDTKLLKMNKLQKTLESLLEQKDLAEQQRINKLSRIYERMEPAQAARLLASLDQKMAIRILSGIKAKTAGKLLDNLDPQVAKRLTTSYSTLVPD